MHKKCETLKLTNGKMHEQIEYLKKEYEELHNELSRKKSIITITGTISIYIIQSNKSKEYEILNNKYKLLKEQYQKKKMNINY